jgi:hypothetical protein
MTRESRMICHCGEYEYEKVGKGNNLESLKQNQGTCSETKQGPSFSSDVDKLHVSTTQPWESSRARRTWRTMAPEQKRGRWIWIKWDEGDSWEI